MRAPQIVFGVAIGRPAEPLEEPNVRDLNVSDHAPAAVRADVGDSEPHQGPPGTAGAAIGEDSKPIALPQPALHLDRVQAHRPNRPAALERQYADNIIARVVLVDVRIGEDRLLLDEDDVSDPMVHRALFIAAGLDAGHLGGQVVTRILGLRDDTQRVRGVHDDGRNVGVCKTVCRLLIAEHAWQRAHPADTVVASIPRSAM